MNRTISSHTCHTLGNCLRTNTHKSQDIINEISTVHSNVCYVLMSKEKSTLLIRFPHSFTKKTKKILTFLYSILFLFLYFVIETCTDPHYIFKIECSGRIFRMED